MAVMSTILTGGFEAIKRKVYFAFHYDDIMRVNNVRNAWKIDHPNSQLLRSFYDSSLWESRKSEGDDAVKRLIREGVQNTSAVCVLVGTETWSRRWVKYEIARAVIDGRGLLSVHINGLSHHQRRSSDQLGFNPLQLLGIYTPSIGRHLLYEKRFVVKNYLTGQGEWEWQPYQDHVVAVSLPRYLSASHGYVVPLSHGAREYDFVAGVGHSNLGTWVDSAARDVGR
ncbi:MAG TPA: TIR domain-containing protein [Rhizomicrobium sp.]|nr:TIR domain-containing protein [Rhizomicrobium sp.]